MQKSFLVFLLFVVLQHAVAQNKDTANISVTNYRLVPGTFSWRDNSEFHDMTSWDSSPYLQGHLKQGTQFRMNYRLLVPQGYNDVYPQGYPLIVMLHGAGERGNCWNDNCYCPDPAQCNPNSVPLTGTDPRFLNNDHQLVHGGSPHLAARNRAGTKLPDDPSLAANAFPGFVLFPQNTNQWRNSGSPASSDVSNAIRIVRLLARQYNIDQDRIYIHGLSMGAQALLEALNYADWLFAAAAPMSPINFAQSLEYDSVRNIPVWIFQGGQDLNPKPAETEGMIESLLAKGANVRYSLYPNLGHGTWNTAYAEPDFFSWFLSKKKSDIHVDYGKPNVCGTTGEGASLVLPQGFLSYQWERDGVVIEGAHSNTYVADIPGTYRARYSRVSATPSESQWNRWSDPVVVGEKSPEPPVVEQLGTNILSDLNVESVAYLKVPEGFEKYHWFQNGQTPQKALVQSAQDPTVFTHAGCTGGGPCVHSGKYTLITEGYDKCPSLPSEPLTILFGTHNTVTVPPAITGTPNNFTFELKSPTSVLLKWNDNSTNERGFEIWRRKLLNVTGEDFNKGWVMATITHEDVTMFLDTDVEPSSTYYYKIRAVSNEGRSNYFPGNTQGNINHNRVVTTGDEDTLPTPPSELVATTVGPGTVRLSWEDSYDASGIRRYYIYYNDDSIATNGVATSFTLSSLPVNEEFNFTLKAEDNAGNLSHASNPSHASTYISGLYYKHSTGAWSAMSQMADTWVNPEFTGWVSSFTLQERTQEDFFNFEFQGYLYINSAGTYTFRTTSDDGSQLFLNDVMIMNNDGLHGNVTVTSTDQSLDAGPTPITVRYFENTGGQTLTVQYRGPDTGNAWTTIPASALKSGIEPAPPVPPAPPTNVVATGSGMQDITLSWDFDETVIVILGSSTAFGTGASPIETHSWVNRLSNWLNTKTTGATVNNLALGGFDTEDVLPSGDPDRNITKALSLSPDIIIVNLPSNDVANGIPPETTISNLETLRTLAQAQGVKIFFTTTQPRNFASQTQREILQQTAQEIRSTFGGFALNIYDELTNPSDLTIKAGYNADGIHVNNDGHEYIFNQVIKKLVPYLISFEVQRSTSESGPYSAAGRTLSGMYIDSGLQPDQTYYYRLRSTSADTVSQFTNPVQASTLPDDENPSQPGKPVLHRTGYATISITWPAASDNLAVLEYEIYANGILIGTTETNAFQATGLLPETEYTFSIIAVDASGNKSVESEALTVQTSAGTLFFTQNGATELNNLNSWRTQLGIAPTSFSDNGQVFVIRHSLPVGSPWTVEGTISKVIIDDGITISINENPVDATIDIIGSGVLNLSATTLPRLGTLSASSRVRYSSNAIQRSDYGHLELLTVNSIYSLEPGVTRVQGNLVAASGATLQGASANTSTLELHGNLTMSGLQQLLPASVRIALHLPSNGNQNVTLAGDPGFSAIHKTGTGIVAIGNSGAPFTLGLGSVAGGGLLVADGAKVQLGNNSLAIRGNGSVNPSGESGTLAITGGNILFESDFQQPSNLHFDPLANSVSRFTFNSTAECFIHSAVKITDAIKVIGGDLHSAGFITIISTAAKTANVEEIEDGGKITGTVHVQQFIGQTGGATRSLSTPVSGTTIADWQSYFPVTGDFPGASPAPGTDPSLFIFNDPDWQAYPSSSNPPPFNTSAAPVEKGKGYLGYIHNVAPVVMEVTGELHQQDVTFLLSASTPGELNSGWNFVGNPYASTIRWNAANWTPADVSSAAAVSRHGNGVTQYEYFDSQLMAGTAIGGMFADGIIAPGEAFWIKATGASPSLTATEKAKVTADHLPEPNTANFIKLIVTSGVRSDAAIIAITVDGTDAFDATRDGLKRKNEGVFNFSSVTSDGLSVAISHTDDEFCAKQVALNLEDATPGTYVISPQSLSSLHGIESVKLADHFANTTVDFGETEEYSFEVTADPMSSGKDRFELILSRSSIDLSVTADVRAVCNEPVSITLTNTQPGIYYGLYNIQGEELAVYPNSTGEDIVFELSAADVLDGENTVVAKASLPGCSSAELPQSIEFEYYHVPTVSASNTSACAGEPATLNATSISSAVTYEWYRDGVRIEGDQGPDLVTAPVNEELYYSVRAVQPNGCKGPEAFIVVSPILLHDPEITQDGDLILVDVPGAQYEWFRNGNTVGSSDEPFLDFTGSGSYFVVVTIGECSRASGDFIVTGIEDEGGSSFHVSVYPNPSHQIIQLRVSSDESDMIGVRVTDVTGRTVFTQKYIHDEWASPISINGERSIAAGIYFLSVEQTTKRKVIRIVLE